MGDAKLMERLRRGGAGGLSGQAPGMSEQAADLSEQTEDELLEALVTSALDEETERKVLTRIRELPDRTCIAVTHRPAALELADLELRVSDRTVQVRALKA